MAGLPATERLDVILRKFDMQPGTEKTFPDANQVAKVLVQLKDGLFKAGYTVQDETTEDDIVTCTLASSQGQPVITRQNVAKFTLVVH